MKADQKLTAAVAPTEEVGKRQNARWYGMLQDISGKEEELSSVKDWPIFKLKQNGIQSPEIWGFICLQKQTVSTSHTVGSKFEKKFEQQRPIKTSQLNKMT